MKLIPQSLLARTAIVLILALVASQVVSVMLFRHYSREPRVQLAAIGFIGQLKTIRAAMEIIPPEQQREFLQRLRDERGVMVFRGRDEPMAVAPDIPPLRAFRERMREELGADSEIFVRARPQKPGAPPVLITRLPVRDGVIFVVIPRNRIVEQDYTFAWAAWGVFGGMLALLGALFLMWRVNRPLKALASAAKDIGRGKTPEPITEMGPSEVKSVAIAFNQMRDDLHRLDQDRTNFLAGVSHDLRTPLARLRLGIEMLPADEQSRRDLEKDIEDINGVISQFMDFARDENDEGLEPCDLSVIVQTEAERAQRSYSEHAISLELQSPLPMQLRPQAMKRVVNNLIDNAIKHAHSEIKIITAVRPGGGVQISVLDRGRGIAPVEVERLKQPFMRLENSRTGASGAGLGLAIVDRIVKQHGGTFTLLPREGGGTEARVILPKK